MLQYHRNVELEMSSHIVISKITTSRHMLEPAVEAPEAASGVQNFHSALEQPCLGGPGPIALSWPRLAG